MEMDDPWGSPWAEEEVQIHHDLESKKAGQNERPKTPVQASTLALEEKTHSPWDNPDDGGFGDWAAISGDDEGTRGLDGTEDDWGSVQASSQLKENLPSALPWGDVSPSPVREPPKLSQSLMPKFVDVVRQPSPDPWATEFQDNEESTAPSTKDGEEDIKELNANVVSHSKSKDLEQLEEPLSEEFLSGGSETPNETSGSPGEDNVPLHANDEVLEPPLVVRKSRVSNDIKDPETISSRPSSSPSEHSRHEENLQDSPRTSIDDEPKRPYVPRKVSSKIQGLVEHFDSLAQPDENPCPEPVRVLREDTPGAADVSQSKNVQDSESPIVTEDVSQSEDGLDDFGDFEEGNSDDEGSITDLTTTKSPDPVKPSPKGDTQGQDRAGIFKKDFGPVNFDINTAALDGLFPESEIEPSTERVFIPDRDLDNTLASTEQRKMWYRISRYGTKRKHDSGDDENYARVNWTHSQMRQDTLKIVARWMEEDRISGRVVLGGVSKGSSVFGWTDMKAAPVPIAQAFAAKQGKKPESSIAAPVPDVPREWPKGLVRSSSASKSRSPPKARRRSSVKSLSISRDTSVSVPGIPAANTDRNSSTVPIQNVPTVETKPSTSATVKLQSPPRNARSSHRSTSSASHKSLPPVVIPTVESLSVNKAKILQSPNPIITQLKDEEEDDEWGEMVASPVVSATPVLPITPKSSSFSNVQPKAIDVPLSPVSLTKTLPHHQTFSSTTIFDLPMSQTPIPVPTQLSQIDDLQSLNGNMSMIVPQDAIGSTFATPASNTSSSSADPWASADFSFFEAPILPAKSTQKVVSKATPPASGSVPKTVKFSDPIPPTQSKSTWRSKEEIEQDVIVQTVVRSLPNLSYMLRR